MADRPYMCRDEGLFLPECDDCSQLEGRVKALEDCCETATEELADHEERISSAESDIDTLQEDLMSAQSDIQSNTDAIDSIERLPEVTSADDGKVLTVVDGKWGIKPSSLVGEAIVGQSTVGEEETESDIDELKERMLSAESNIASLEENKQNKLTAGAGIQIQNDVISTTGSGDEGKADYTRIDECNDIVSFQADAKGVPLKSLTATINPKQDLNGYDKPWVGGAGKNKLDESTFTSNDTFAESNGVFSNASTDPRNYFSAVVRGYHSDDTFEDMSITPFSATGRQAFSTFTPQADIVRIAILHSGSQLNLECYFDCQLKSGQTYNASLNIIGFNPQTVGGLSFDKIQIETGTTATSYEPYSNICPISGWDSVSVNVTGVNVWDEEWEVGALTQNGNYPSTTNIRSKNYIPCVGGATYFSKCSAQIVVFQYDENKTFIRLGAAPYILVNSNRTFTTLTNARYMRFYTQPAYGITYNNDISINYPSTDTDYHAYTGDTYTTDLPETVYGGSLDVVNGVLTVDRAMVDMGTLDWTYSTDSVPRFGATLSFDVKYVSEFNAFNGVSSEYKIVSFASLYNPNTSVNGTIAAFSATRLAVRNDAYTDATSFKTAMNGVQLVYELAEPRTIQLTPKQVTTLLGTNNVWADSGEVCLEYEHTQGVPTLKARRTTYTTTESSEDTFALTDYIASDILFVYVNGLMLVEGDEYTIVGTNVVLTTPITNTGTTVHIVALQAR